MNKQNEPKWWLSLLKLVLGAAVLIYLVGMVLEYFAQYEQSPANTKPDQSWGIVVDSPIR